MINRYYQERSSFNLIFSNVQRNSKYYNSTDFCVLRINFCVLSM